MAVERRYKCDGEIMENNYALGNDSRSRNGFTVVELLVSIAIIGVLMAILVPAVQYAREAARRSQCKNNLKQLAHAIQLHELTYQVMPSDGWGYLWIGEPDRGTGIKQPGGWIYQILPYIERNDLRQMGSGMSDSQREQAIANLTQMGTALARCPSRPSAELCPLDPNLIWYNADLKPAVSRTDYAGNAGDFFYGVFRGPSTLAQGDSNAYTWPDASKITGVFYVRSATRMGDLTDGSTHTYLIGEKYVAKPHYAGYGDNGYDQPLASGDDWDLVRWTDEPPSVDGDGVFSKRFGSAHTSGFHMALCDGSVRAIGYSIDATVHKQLGSRTDSGPSSDDF